MIKYLRLFLIVGMISACATTSSPDGDRLPEPTEDGAIFVQWEEYCARNEWKDPACEELP